MEVNKIIVIINKLELTEPISYSLSIQKAEDLHPEEGSVIFRVQGSHYPKKTLNSASMGRPFILPECPGTSGELVIWSFQGLISHLGSVVFPGYLICLCVKIKRS